MNQFDDKGLISSLHYTAKRYSKTNTRYINFYNDRDVIKCIAYPDANSVYGWAMSQCLHYRGFK